MMIIECVNCNKKFNVNSELIPSAGRTIQCGSCDHLWFYKKNDIIKPNLEKIVPTVDAAIPKQKIDKIDKKSKSIKQIYKKGSEIVEYKSKSNFSFSNFLSYLTVLIISFIALIIVLDTFKSPLYKFFPNLEIILFNLFELLKDIKLFIKDLI
tara:strand:+ start:38 stop:496 length:459 start_codon:yes stop_codon:yes gene_type:complete